MKRPDDPLVDRIDTLIEILSDWRAQLATLPVDADDRSRIAIVEALAAVRALAAESKRKRHASEVTVRRFQKWTAAIMGTGKAARERRAIERDVMRVFAALMAPEASTVEQREAIELSVRTAAVCVAHGSNIEQEVDDFIVEPSFATRFATDAARIEELRPLLRKAIEDLSLVKRGPQPRGSGKHVSRAVADASLARFMAKIGHAASREARKSASRRRRAKKRTP